ncbi:MAG: 50S ribosomal protein L25 [Verrucomicrobia bacterium]|nr:50S ribosomal protein L25 [Verrucomicrobiota bacterium]
MYKREGSKKSDLSLVRRAGNVPAVLYSAGNPSEKITIDGVGLKAALRSIAPGQLSTTLFTLVDGDNETSVIVKEIQYFPTSYDIRHVDLLSAKPKQLVRVRVPIEYTGTADCQGIKLGGFLRQVIRYVLVECFADKIPSSLPLDVRELVIGQSKRLSELTFPEGVRPLVDVKEVAVVIAKR